MKYPDARGWIGIGAYVLCIIVLAMIAFIPSLRTDEHFKTLATLVVGTAFVSNMVQWAYGATKSGGELAKVNSDTVAAAASSANTTDAASDAGK